MRNAAIIHQYFPHIMRPGVVYPVQVTVRNTGDETWFVGEQFRLGSQNPTNNEFWGLYRISLNKSVAPGDVHTFEFDIVSLTPGVYPCDWRMVLDGVEWFGEVCVNSIRVEGQISIPISNLSGDKTQVQIFDTRRYISDQQWRSIPWVNNTGIDLLIVSAYLWTGIDYTGVCDTHVRMIRDRDQSIIHQIAWDHYSDPTSPEQGNWIDTSMVLQQGEGIILDYFTSWSFLPTMLELGGHHAGVIGVRPIE